MHQFAAADFSSVSPGEEALQHSASLSAKTSEEPVKTFSQTTPIACQLQKISTESFLRIAPARLLSNTCLFTCSEEQRDDTGLIRQLANSGPDNLESGICLPIRKRRGGTGQAGLRRWTNSQCDLPSMLSVAKITLMCSGLQVNVSCPI